MADYDYGITDTLFGYRDDTPGNATGNSNGPRRATNYVVVHTQEGGTGDAVGLARYCNGNDVSYNIEVDDERTVLNVPVTEGPWAAAEANDIAVHICFAGSYAAWDAAKWQSTDTADGLNESAMLDRGARAAAAACKQFGIPVVYAGDGGRSGWPVLPKGIAGHRDFGRRGGGHHDPGDGFPMDEFLRRVQRYLGSPAPAPAPQPTPGGSTTMPSVPEIILAQETGSTVPGQFPGWPARRWHLAGDAQPSLTQTDYLREIDREVNSLFNADAAPDGMVATLVGQILAIRKGQARIEGLLTQLLKEK